MELLGGGRQYAGYDYDDYDDCKEEVDIESPKTRWEVRKGELADTNSIILIVQCIAMVTIVCIM